MSLFLLPSPTTITLLTLILTFLLCILFSPSVHAQESGPPDFFKCTAFGEGQAFYLFGRDENLVLDLSVPWNTSKPVFKKVNNGPAVHGQGCATTDNGDLFVLTAGAGFIYNLKANSWTSFEHPDFATSNRGQFGVSDPETGIIYIKDEVADFRSESTLYSVDLRTKTVSTSKVYAPSFAQGVAWSAYLKSIVVVDRPISLFTPSKVAEPSGGRSTFIATSKDGDLPTSRCAASAYGGSVVVFTAYDIPKDHGHVVPKGIYVYILDVANQTWKRGPVGGDLTAYDAACAVSGDHFILWGCSFDEQQCDRTLAFNIKTEKWVSRYTPPSLRPTTTTLQPSQTPIQQPNTISGPGSTSSSNKKHASIIVAATGCLLVIILGLFV
ncbi:MAG: hypothetical protein J3Q66DRAFT_370094 [Benniella sp.]|nr:MAG: hypothetical protein J3Q66DRAFT_370094 [Benniella sp.]